MNEKSIKMLQKCGEIYVETLKHYTNGVSMCSEMVGVNNTHLNKKLKANLQTSIVLPNAVPFARWTHPSSISAPPVVFRTRTKMAVRTTRGVASKALLTPNSFEGTFLTIAGTVKAGIVRVGRVGSVTAGMVGRGGSVGRDISIPLALSTASVGHPRIRCTSLLTLGGAKAFAVRTIFAKNTIAKKTFIFGYSVIASPVRSR